MEWVVDSNERTEKKKSSRPTTYSSPNEPAAQPPSKLDARDLEATTTE